MKADAPKPDPSLAIEKAAAEAEKVMSIQERLVSRTASFTRMFGAAGRRKSLQGGSRRPAIAGV